METEKGLLIYKSSDGQQVRLSFDIVRKYLVSGRSDYVLDSEIVLYMGMCKARGLNPFKRDCYLIKYTSDDPATTIISIDYFRARAKAQKDCQGWQAGIIVCDKEGKIDQREGHFIVENEKLLGGWFKAKPKGWEIERTHRVSLKPYIKTTREGKPTRFWSEEHQAEQIAKVAESQGLRRVWPDEFAQLYIKEEIIEVQASDVLDEAKPRKMEELKEKLKKEKISPPVFSSGSVETIKTATDTDKAPSVCENTGAEPGGETKSLSKSLKKEDNQENKHDGLEQILTEINLLEKATYGVFASSLNKRMKGMTVQEQSRIIKGLEKRRTEIAREDK